MDKRTKTSLSVSVIVVATIVVVVISQKGFAWTNPTSNPPFASSAISVSSGNVGIGTTSPLSKLYIEGGSANWNETAPGLGIGSIHLNPGSTADHFGSGISWGASDASNGQNAQAGIYVRSDGSYGTRMYFATTDAYVAGSKTRMMIDSAGNVGIGTAGPGQKLSVAGIIESTSGGFKFPDGSVQVSAATGDGNRFYASNANFLANAPLMATALSMTENFTGGKVNITANGSFDKSYYPTAQNFYIYVDGVQKARAGQNVAYGDGATYTFAFSSTIQVTLSAGAHTIEIRYTSNGSGLTSHGLHLTTW